MFTPAEALTLLVVVAVLIVATVSAASLGLIWLENRQVRRDRRAGKVTIDLAQYLELVAGKTALDLLEPAARRAAELLAEGDMDEGLRVLSRALHAEVSLTGTFPPEEQPAPLLRPTARPSSQITTDPHG